MDPFLITRDVERLNEKELLVIKSELEYEIELRQRIIAECDAQLARKDLQKGEIEAINQRRVDALNFSIMLRNKCSLVSDAIRRKPKRELGEED